MKKTDPGFSRRSLVSFGVTALLAVTAAAAQVATNPPAATIDTSGNYQSEVQACMQGRTGQDQADCLKEARNALADKKRGVLDSGANFQANARARCGVLTGEDKAACEARMMGYGTVSGSVAGGGVIREVETVVMPAGQGSIFFFLMIRRPPRSIPGVTLCRNTTRTSGRCSGLRPAFFCEFVAVSPPALLRRVTAGRGRNTFSRRARAPRSASRTSAEKVSHMVGNKLQWIGIGAWGAIVAGAMVACGGGGGAPDAQGTMRFAITDAPACGYDQVWVTVEKVGVHTSGSAQDADAGWNDLTLSPAKRIDLLTLTNGVLEELGSMPLNPGHYSQVRLVLAPNTAGAATPANAVQPTGGAVIPLATPSGQQSGLKLQVNADVAAGQMADLVLDFDACRSVVKSGNSGNYNLKPVVSVVPRIVSGITGAIAVPALTPASTSVSAQQNGATVRSTTPDAAGNFSLPFLQPGSYTIVITSEAHATGVITGVTAGATTTSLGAPITLPASAMAVATGAVTAASAPVTDAAVRATQSLTGGPVIEVARQPVDGAAGTYQLRLPQAAPVRAAASSTLTFTPDTPVAGKYTLESTAPGRAAMTKPADVGTSTNVQVNFGY